MTNKANHRRQPKGEQLNWGSSVTTTFAACGPLEPRTISNAISRLQCSVALACNVGVMDKNVRTVILRRRKLPCGFFSKVTKRISMRVRRRESMRKG